MAGKKIILCTNTNPDTVFVAEKKSNIAGFTSVVRLLIFTAQNRRRQGDFLVT